MQNFKREVFNVKETVYQILGLFFHLKNYVHNNRRPDDHLANIVINKDDIG